VPSLRAVEQEAVDHPTISDPIAHSGEISWQDKLVPFDV
jgi:hypothetical protein